MALAIYPTGAWFFIMGDGRTDVSDKAYPYYVWPVRGGQSGSIGNLSISKSGTGTGTVTNSPAGINCGLRCTTSYLSNSIISLSAIPDGGSLFSGWGGDCTDGSILLSDDKSCSATFDLCQGSPVSVGGSPYAWINSACTAAGASDTIKLMAVNHLEDVNLASGKNIKLEGGYDCSFTTKGTQTTITGSLTISSGTVELDDIVIF